MLRDHSLPAGKKHHASIRKTLFIESLCLLCLAVVVLTIATYFLAGSALKSRATAQMESMVDAKERLLEATIAKQREQLAIIGRDPTLTTLPALTNIVGFRELVSIDLKGNVTALTEDMQGHSLLSATVIEKSLQTKETFFLPIITDAGFEGYVIASPQIDADDKRIGTLIATFDSRPLIRDVLALSSLGKTAQAIIVTEQDDAIVLLRMDDTNGNVVPLRMGKESTETSTLAEKTLDGKEGLDDAVDYAGIRVLAAYRYMPSLGWGLIVQLDRYELIAPVIRLATNLAATGLAMVGLLSLSMFFLASRIVEPIEELTRKINGLEAKHWKFKRSIRSGNELEVVDMATESLTKRLRMAHEHLEEVVRERTGELRAQHAQDAAILESIDYGLLVTDNKGAIMYLNAAGERLTGWEAAKIFGTHFTKVLTILGKDGAVLTKPLHPLFRVLRTKECFNPEKDPEFSLRGKNGLVSALQLRVTPILHGRQCLGTVTVFRDITDERRIDHMKSEFISLVSHQLRTPLSSMRWYLEMLLSKDEGPLTEGQQQYVEEVSASNARMVHLVNALLNVSRLELGKVQVNPETIDTVKLCEEIGDSFKLELQRKRMTIEITPKERSEIEMRSDKGLLQLILENLVSNAIKYGREETKITIQMQVNHQKAVTILVTDVGIGIPENQQASIFRKLFRGTNARLSDTDGSGLGLYISRVAAESIGGTLNFKSKENAGTTFTLFVPAPSVKIEPATTQLKQQQQQPPPAPPSR